MYWSFWQGPASDAGERGRDRLRRWLGWASPGDRSYGEMRDCCRFTWSASALGGLPELDGESRQLLHRAVHQAVRFEHEYIGTEHLLLALVDGDGPLAGVPTRLGVTTESIYAEIERILMPGAGLPGAVSGPLPLTPRAESAVALAAEEALRSGEPAVSPAHLLLGLMGEDEGMAAHIMSNLGVTVPAVRVVLAG